MNVFPGMNNDKDIFKLLPQAIAGLKKTIIDPLLGDGVTDKYANEQPPLQAQLYEQAEIAASSKRLGLWQENNPMPPWDWRKK